MGEGSLLSPVARGQELQLTLDTAQDHAHYGIASCQCAVYCVHVQCAVYRYSVQCTGRVCSVPVQCTVYLYNLKYICAIYIVHCTVCSIRKELCRRYRWPHYRPSVYTAQHRAAQHCTLLLSALYSIAMHCSALHYTALHCTVHCTAQLAEVQSVQQLPRAP